MPNACYKGGKPSNNGGQKRERPLYLIGVLQHTHKKDYHVNILECGGDTHAKTDQLRNSQRSSTLCSTFLHERRPVAV